MHAKRLFLQWALMTSLTAVGVVIAALLGWFGTMYRLDVTKLSLVILAVFAAATAWCGRLAWRTDLALGAQASEDGKKLGFQKFVKETENQAEHGWFAVGLCEKLGLTGTVFGFIIMLVNGFGGFAISDPLAIQRLLERLSAGMSTAFVTTLVGVVCSILLSLQFHQLERSLERLKS